MSDKILVSLENGIKRITINNPTRRNALDFDAFKYLTEIIQQSAEDETKGIVLTGAGNSFCAGADLQAFGGDAITLWRQT